MRNRSIPALGCLAVTLLTVSTARAQDVPADDPRRGLVFRDLERGRPEGRCGRHFELRRGNEVVGCTHGPDPAPPGVDVRQRRQPEPTLAEEAMTAASGPVCHGDGRSGYRVQLIYARAANVPDRYSEYLSSFRQWAAQVDDLVNLSAAETGGSRRVRFVHDSACLPVIARVQLSTRGDDSMTNTMEELRGQGYTASDRKYLVWMDANVYCGIGEIWEDDRPGPENANNGRPGDPGMIGRIDNGCWGRTSQLVEAHELGHLLGAVQQTAPNGTPNAHCTDESDRLCYSDGPGITVRYVCPSSQENRYDCNHDDYFHTAPPPGSYLATHWNAANNRFLVAGAPTSTTVTPTSGETASPVTVSAIGAPTGNVAYVVRFSSAAVTCPTGTVISGPRTADAAGTIPPTTAIIPASATPGRRWLCFTGQADPSESTPATSFSVL